MPDPVLDRIRAWLSNHENELLERYRDLLRFPSIESDSAPGAPFGNENRDALDFMLGIGQKWGMSTRDLDGYIGYAEFGIGDRLVMSLGHLDVVPVGPGWKHEPFGAEIDEGYVYARGAVDDKGPTMASFYAMRAIQECVPGISARMRSVFGCDEESGFECIHHYTKTEESPTFGVAPDSGWPLIHAEKGIANLVISAPIITGDLTIVRIQGGQRPNIVIDACEALIEVSTGATSYLEAKLADAWDRNVSATWQGSNRLHIFSRGKAAHGSTPFAGDSAAIRLFRFLAEVAPLSQEKKYSELFELTQINGAGLGINGEDEISKDLTCNLGIVESADGVINLTFNVRYPVTWKGDNLRQKCEKHLKGLEGGYRLASFDDAPPLYFPLDHPLVTTICEVYREETEEEGNPGVMGGGTYARAIPNTVSIGTGWMGDGKAHETDERLKIEHLYKMSRIYAHIFYRLATL